MNRTDEAPIALLALHVLATDAAKGFQLPSDASAVALHFASAHAPSLGPDAAVAVRLYAASRLAVCGSVSKCLTV